MADEKKFTAQEAAIAVLKKTEEMFKKSKLVKAENPDEKQDAKLGEAVEHLCEEHMVENKDAERKEGHKLVAKAECMKCMKSMHKSELGGLYEDLAKLEVMFKGEDMAGDKKAPSDSLNPASNLSGLSILMAFRCNHKICSRSFPCP